MRIMAGGTHTQDMRQPVNWAEKYIERLSRDMEELRGMEARLIAKIDANNAEINERIDTNIAKLDAKIDANNKELTERIDANNKQTQNLVLAMIIGIGAMTLAITIALR